MTKTILITGATDGIGLETAKMLIPMGHHVLLHGRNATKLDAARDLLRALDGGGRVETFLADLSNLAEVAALADAVATRHDHLDVLINNAGVYNADDAITPDGLDIRFAVNTIAPYLLTRRLLPRLGAASRVVNLSSAAQSPVDPGAIAGETRLTDGEAYAQSKLAITAWTGALAASLGEAGPAIIAVNPGSLLGSKMVRQAFGIAGGDVGVGAAILCRAALDDEFATASGRYFDNDAGRFAAPHPEALDEGTSRGIIRAMESVLAARGY